MRKKVNVYEAFIEGAKGGINTSITIIPYLVGMLVAIGVLRNSGVLGLIVSGFDWVFRQMGINTDFTAALPTALMRPLSGSGSRAMMIDTMKTYIPIPSSDVLLVFSKAQLIMTFYIVALYFGSGIANALCDFCWVCWQIWLGSLRRFCGLFVFSLRWVGCGTLFLIQRKN